MIPFAPLGAVYSSPLSRALGTAAVIAEPHGLPVRTHDGLSEIRVGEWEGLTVAVVAHSGVNKTILLTLLGAPLSSYWRIRQHNACVNVLEYHGDRAVMLVMNETSHLTLAAGQAQPIRF